MGAFRKAGLYMKAILGWNRRKAYREIGFFEEKVPQNVNFGLFYMVNGSQMPAFSSKGYCQGKNRENQLQDEYGKNYQKNVMNDKATEFPIFPKVSECKYSTENQK